MLVWGALAVLGAGAGQALSTTFDLGDIAGAQACLVRNGISVDGTDPVALDQAAYRQCMEDNLRVQATAVLAGAVALPAAAWLLVLLGGLAERWRLRPGRITGIPAASQRLTERFAVLCDSQGLTRRDRPHLVLAPPGTGVTQAFTTGLPGTRPWVVIPLAYAYAEPIAFDAVAAHEVGHVRARDVLWASAVWWAGWLAVPALLLALVPLAAAPEVVWEFYGLSLLVSLVVAVVMFVLRAGLLRRRELAADRHALEVTADPNALARVVKPAKKRRTGVFAIHPAAADRLALDVDAPDREGGFVSTATAGVVAMTTYHATYLVLGSLLPFNGTAISSASVVAALLWASVVVPSWTRQAASDPSGWTGRLAGAVVGLVVGYCLQPPGLSTITAPGPERDLLPLPSLLLVLVPGLVVAAFAVALLTAGLVARLAAHPGHRRPGGLGAALAVTAVLAAAVGTLTGTATVHVATGGTASFRSFLVTNGYDQVWRHTAALLLVALALVVRRPGRPAAVVSGVTAVVGAVAAALSWQLRLDDQLSDARSAFLAYQTWWICALAGLVAAVAVVIVNGGALPELPSGVLCGLLVAASAGGAQYLIRRVRHGGDSNVFQETLQAPGWLLVLALVGTAPLTASLVVMVRRREPRHGAVRWAAGGVTALLALLLVAGGLSGVTTAESDFAQPDTRSQLAEQASPRPDPPVEAEKPLDQAAATAALADVPGVLPPGAKSVPNIPDDSSSVQTPATCDAALDRSIANEKALPRAAEVEQRFTFPLGGRPDGGSISVSITSYSTPPPGFSDIDAENQACADFRQLVSPEENRYYDFHITLRPALDFPLARRRSITGRGQLKGVATLFAFEHYTAIFGLNRVDVALDWFHLGTSPPQAFLDEVERLVTNAMNAIVAKL
ncbi:hypothetical protein GCM10010185_52130 [Saccharothrix coeruleofusca]|uniref:Peptidase M48 domain-containing protein n=1 Tax=Saccharothrix coeruleofusca TaxID=33919 RepID=A0A918EGZ2_9PSEU|nr:hypothetical protein GCM10010185_52130 [Saccharothrix coeruleofusca]